MVVRPLGSDGGVTDEGRCTMTRHTFAFVIAAVLLVPSVSISHWNLQLVDDISGGGAHPTSIAYDSNRCPHIAYTGTAGLMYARWNGSGGWFVEVALATLETPYFCSLALDHSDRPHIAWGYYYATTDESGEWTIEHYDVTDTGRYASIALTYDALDRVVPQISYNYGTYGSLGLKHAYRDPESGEWGAVPVDATVDVDHLSTATDGDGKIYISYYDDTHGNLKFAHFDGTKWGWITVDGLDGDVGKNSSIALDATGTPHITYYDVTNGELKHATISPGR